MPTRQATTLVNKTMNTPPPQAVTQRSRILEWMQAGRTINPMQALKVFGCFRLGARVHELKKMGFPIKKEMVSSGTRKKFAQYRL